MTNAKSEFLDGVREGPRLYFAPLMGALSAIRKEIRLQTTCPADKEEPLDIKNAHKRRD